jgi:sorbitol-specific phosphotransferase system component IIC
VNYIKKNDFGHCWKGILSGVAMIGLAVTNLALFFGYYVDTENEVTDR